MELKNTISGRKVPGEKDNVTEKAVTVCVYMIRRGRRVDVCMVYICTIQEQNTNAKIYIIKRD